MNRILIIAPSWVGDLIMAQPLLSILKKQHPSALIDVMAPRWCFPLLHRMKEVNEAMVSPFQHGKLVFFERYRMGRRLINSAYQKAYILPNSFKSALVPYFAKIPQRIGWRGEGRYGLLNDLRILDPEKYVRMVDRFMALAYSVGEKIGNMERFYPTLQINDAERQQTIKKFHLTSEPLKPVVVMCPGAAGGIGKCWPAKHYAQVADEMSLAGKQVWVLGSESDRPLSEVMEKNCQHEVHNFVGQTTLSECIDLLSFASVIISNDSGLLHVSAALDKPIVGIYGPTSPYHAPPLCDKLSIVSCYEPSMTKQDLNSQKIITQITPRRVLHAIFELHSPRMET